MKQIKVKIYKDPKGNGRYINKTSKFLQKAKAGMQVDDLAVDQDILDQLTLTTDVDEIADNISKTYGVSYFDALDKVEKVVEFLYRQDVADTKNEMLDQDPIIDEPIIKKPPLYSLEDEWESSNDEGWDDEGEDSEDDLAAEDEAALSVEKKGGTVNKKKFVKNIVRGLKKANEGMQQDESSNASILDKPVGGREAFINQFRRGIKDLGNTFYAEKIYDQTQKLNNEVRSLPPISEAEEGMQMPAEDPHDAWDHLQAYTGSISNIFTEPMNQIHGAGFENLPEARKGREQRQAERQQRQMAKDWKGMFGDMAAGYAGVPGMPNYLQIISPQFVNPQVARQGAPQGNQSPTGPFIDVEYKKGPWWKGNREWSAKGIPAEMLMGMSGGRGRGIMPGYGYMPGGYNYSASWSTSRTFPGEIIRTKSSYINAAADPSKNSTTVNNSTAVNNSTTVNSSASSSTSPGSTSSSASSSTAPLNNNPANNSTTDNVTTNTSGKSTPGAILIYPGATDTYLVQMSDGALIQKIGNPRDPKPDDPVKARYNPEQAKGILPKLTSPNPMKEDWMFSGASTFWPDEYGDVNSASNTRNMVEFEDDIFKGKPYDDKGNQYSFEDTNRFLKKSGKPDIKSTWRDESKVFSSPYSAAQYDKVMDTWSRLYDIDEAKASEYYNANIDVIDNESYIITDDKGNEYSAWANYGALPPDYQEKRNAIWSAPGDVNFDWIHQNKDLLYKPYAYGGNVSGPMPDQYGNLQKFIYGGGDDVSPIVSYEDNYINSKNTDDPFMFRNGGLYKYEGPDQSQVTPGTTTQPGATPPAWKDLNEADYNAKLAEEKKKWEADYAKKQQGSGTGIKAGSPAPGYTWEEWNALPEATRTKIGQSLQGQYNRTQTRTQTQGGYYPQGNYGYPTAPKPFQQILDMFSPFKRNSQTGKNYDFDWYEQVGPPTTLDGKPYQPQGQPGANPQKGGNSGGGGYKIEYPYTNPLTGEVVTGPNQDTRGIEGAPQGNQQPGATPKPQAGYMYDYKLEKGPWWSGKRTMTLTGKWVDPNNPNAGAAQPGSGNTQSNQFNNGKGPTLDAGSKAPGASNFAESADGKTAMSYTTGDENTTGKPNKNATNAKDYYGYTDDYWNSLSRRQKRWEKNSMRTQQEFDLEKANNPSQASTQTGPTNTSSTAPTQTQTQQGAFPPGDPRGDYMKSQLTVPDKPVTPEPMPAGFPANNVGPVNDQMAYGGYVPEYMAFGGYMPSYQGGGPNAGSGPFDPNISGIAGGGIGPCTEEQVLNAAPGDPCYNESYSKTKSTPQDFQVKYNLNRARTLSGTGISNLGFLAGNTIQGIDAMNQNRYNDTYLKNNLTADNREPENELDYRGGYSGLNQRIMSKTQGAGATGFNSVVGNAAFVKKGGQLEYRQGGVYDLTQEEIGQILAAGGQIKFI